MIGSTLKKAPSQEYIESFKLLIRGGFVKVSDDNSIVLSTTAIRSMEKLMLIITESFRDYQPMKIYSSNQVEIAFEYLNSEIKSYRQLPSKSRFINFKTNKRYFLKNGLLYPNISETLNFITITDPTHKEKEINKQIKEVVRNIFGSLNIDVHEFDSFNPFDLYTIYSENKELAVLIEEGKEQYVICKKCDYHSRKEVAITHKDTVIDDELRDILEVHTPGINTIANLAELLEVEESKCAKVVFYSFKITNKSNIAIVILRGDMEVSEYKLKQVLKTDDLQFATDAEITSIKAIPGYGSAIGVDRDKCIVIVDDLIPKSTNLAAGANKLDYHFSNTNYDRDYEADLVSDISLAQENDRCIKCQSEISIVNGVPLFYSSIINNSEIVDFLDNNGKPQKTDILLSYFDITRIFGTLARVVDKFGIILPSNLSPFQFVLITVGNGNDVINLSNDLYSNLKDKYDILFDNRDVKIGVKLADADLRSIPFRLIISDKNIENNEIEFSIRGLTERNFYPVNDVELEMQKILK